MNLVAPKILNLKDTSYSFDEISRKIEDWLIKTKTTKDQRVFVVLKALPNEGLNSFLHRLRSKSQLDNVRFLFMLDKNVPDCIQTEVFYQGIFKQDVLYSVYKNGAWGTYVKVPQNALQENGQLSNSVFAAHQISRYRTE